MQTVVNALPAAPAQETRVLVVKESEREIGLLTQRLAQGGPCLVHRRVESAESMRQALLTEDWDVVISEGTASGFSSRAALAVLKATGRDIPLIVCSGTVLPTAATAIASGLVKDRAARPVRTYAPVSASHESDVGSSYERAGDYDALTGLASRACFMRLAPAVLAACGPAEQALVCFIDFARFGRVNDVLGHEAGDTLLAQIGLRLKAYASTGLVARFGGTEFVVFQPGFPNEDAMHRYVQALASELEHPCTYHDLELYVASALGVSVYPEGGKSLAELVLNAETALHQCKRLMGRDAYLFYFPELDPARGENLLLESALRQALQRDELRLYYQPCIALATGRVTTVEALVRWEHPELGLLTPESFISLAADCGLVGEIDAWVLREASRQSSVWRAAGHEFTIAVNVSAAEFAHPRLLGRAATALRETGIAPNALELEITESALLRDSATTIATLQALRKMGIRIALDDFGTGYSSLAYLKLCPVDVLKIDKSFVKNIAANRGDAAIAQTIIALAHNLGMTVHAEGVETQQQLDILARRGCDRVQGHFFARPVPAEELVALVRRLEESAVARAL